MMSRSLAVLGLSILALAAPARSSETPPPVEGQVTFLYFNDLPRADAFYGETLGLEKEFELDWVRIYKLSPTSSVGLVDATHGSIRPSDDKPVMVSLVVDASQLEAWWRYLKDRGAEVSELSPEGDGAVRAFSFKDPEGYALEVFAWLDQ